MSLATVAGPRPPRSATAPHLRAAVIGSGCGGLAAAIRRVVGLFGLFLTGAAAQVMPPFFSDRPV